MRMWSARHSVEVGGTHLEHEYIPLHSPEFDIDEGVLKVGAAYFDTLARRALVEYVA